MTTEPTTTQYEQYDRMLAANVDEDIAAYLAGLTECGCVLPEHSCRACRAQARYYREEQTLDELLSMESKVMVTSLGDRITVACAPEAHARVVDCWRGLKAHANAVMDFVVCGENLPATVLPAAAAAIARKGQPI